jgi:hypothetical protein
MMMMMMAQGHRHRPLGPMMSAHQRSPERRSLESFQMRPTMTASSRQERATSPSFQVHKTHTTA